MRGIRGKSIERESLLHTKKRNSAAGDSLYATTTRAKAHTLDVTHCTKLHDTMLELRPSSVGSNQKNEKTRIFHPPR